VDGGWLEGLEVEGLDADGTLDPERPLVFRDANGVALAVQVTPREDGRVSLRFTRRMAPRRGEYDIELAWTTSLATSRARDDGAVLEARWVFPAWHYGLDGVEIRWLVPEGAAPQPDAEITAPIETEISRVEGHEELRSITYRRAHLPRTSEWETLVLVPASAWPHAVGPGVGSSIGSGAEARGEAHESGAEATVLVEGPEHPAAPPLAEDASHAADATACALALLIALGAWLKRRDLELRARRVRRQVLGLVPAPRWVATLASLLLAGIVVVSQLVTLDVGALVAVSGLVVALGWQRSTQGAALPRLSALAPVSSRELRRAQREAGLDWVAPAAWLEPTRLGAVSVLTVAYAVIEADGSSRALAALWAALVVSGSRTRLGVMPTAALRVLGHAMSALRVELGPPHVSVRLLARGAIDPTDARIHLSLSHDGDAGGVLEHLRAELSTEERAPEQLSLRLSAREGTSAEDALGAWADSEGLRVSEIARRPSVRVPVRAEQVGRELDRIVRGVLAHAPRGDEDTLPGDAVAVAAE